jgi:hypothetical protein
MGYHKLRWQRKKRPKKRRTVTARASATAGPPTTKVEFKKVTDLADVTRDETHVSAMFVERGNMGATSGYLFYTAYADYPTGRVLLSASERIPYSAEFVSTEKRIRSTIARWRKRGVTVYEGSVTMGRRRF